jgi:hypothetical protein
MLWGMNQSQPTPLRGADEDPGIRRLIDQMSESRIRERLFYLAKDPLPFRKVNYTIPGHAKSTLDEADDWIESQLAGWGYAVWREACQGQAFACDRTKPLHHWYAAPPPDAPFYTLHNLYAMLGPAGCPPFGESTETSAPACNEIILLCSHKDSQSWIDCPGANDNAIGTACQMEIARVLRDYSPRHAIHFLFCNEEHIPWTSVAAAQGYRRRGQKLLGVFNTDGMGVKSDEDRAAGKMTNLSMYTTPEGKELADLVAEVNQRYGLGLIQSSRLREHPGDDDGSFVKAGFPRAIANFGGHPNGDPQYHMPGDVPERTDVKNATLTARAVLAAVLTLDKRE